MADTKISDLAANPALADADLFPVVDRSDTSMAASGTDTKATAAEVATYVGTKLALSSTYQPLDSDLTAIAALTTTTFGRALLALADAAALRTAGGVVIGTDVQAYDADLGTIAGLTPSNDDVLQRKAGAWTNRTIAQLVTDLGLGSVYQPLDSDLTAIAALTTTSYGRAFLALADASAARTAIGAVIGTDVQAYDAELAALAGLTSAADSVPYFTGSGTAALATVTAAARTVLDDATVAAMCTTLQIPVTLSFILSDETTTLTTGTKLTYEIPFAMTLTAVPKASLTTAGTGTTVDIKESGTSILTNKIVFDSGETSITTAATPPTLADSSIANNAVLTFIVDATAGAAAGLKVSLTGYRT
jgi:hypothetical protein